MSPPPLAVVDTESLLAAAITNLPAATGGDGLVVPLAQITPANRCEYYGFDISIDVRSPAGAAIRGETLTGFAFCMPEPLSIAQLMIASAALLAARRRVPLAT